MMTETEPVASLERTVPTQAVLFEVARVCEGCPSPRALLNPLDHYEQVEGARAIAMYLLHHDEVGKLTPGAIAELFQYPQQEVEQYCELVEMARFDNAKFSGFLEGMIRRLRLQSELDAPIARAIPAALPTVDTSARVREILAQKPPRVVAPLGAPVYVRGVTDDDTATESTGVPEDATVADLFRSPDEWPERSGVNPYARKGGRPKGRGRRARIAAVASARARSSAAEEPLEELDQDELGSEATVGGLLDLDESAKPDWPGQFGKPESDADSAERPFSSNRPRRASAPTRSNGRVGRNGEILHAYQSGTPVTLLAAKYAVSREAIYLVLRKAGVQRAPRSVTPVAPEVQHLADGRFSLRVKEPKVTHLADGRFSIAIAEESADEE